MTANVFRLGFAAYSIHFVNIANFPFHAQNFLDTVEGGGAWAMLWVWWLTILEFLTT